MKLKIMLFALAGILLVGSVAMADTFNPIGGVWTNLIASNEGGTPFWANPSNDGNNQNVGFQILGLSVPNPQYWSISGGVDNNVTFAGAGGGQTETLLIEIAGNAGSNALWAYNVADPLNLSQRIQIFAGGAAPTTTTSVSIPYANYGFLMIGPGGTFFSGSGNGESSSDTTSNFAFFRNANLGGTWWVGVEDLPNPISNERVGDYNDMIFRVSTVPIPPTALLLGSGLLGLVGLRRFRKG